MPLSRATMKVFAEEVGINSADIVLTGALE